jgi:uncharacterized membrane protein YciS (DUF1049 family)
MISETVQVLFMLGFVAIVVTFMVLGMADAISASLAERKVRRRHENEFIDQLRERGDL